MLALRIEVFAWKLEEYKFPIMWIKCHDILLIRYVDGCECLGNITSFFYISKSRDKAMNVICGAIRWYELACIFLLYTLFEKSQLFLPLSQCGWLLLLTSMQGRCLGPFFKPDS